MTEPRVIRKSLRRQVRRPGLSLNVASDINAVVSTGSSASSEQRVTTVQRARSRATDPTHQEDK